jgi:hypothetical protein
MIAAPEAVLFAIKALARLGTQARKAYEDSVVGQDISLPGVDLKPFGAAESAASRLDNALLQDEIPLPAAELAALTSDVRRILQRQGTDDERFLAGNRLIGYARRFYPDLVLLYDNLNNTCGPPGAALCGPLQGMQRSGRPESARFYRVISWT